MTITHQIVVKSKRDAERIADIIGYYNYTAGKAYMFGFHRRNWIEQAAYEENLGINSKFDT